VLGTNHADMAVAVNRLVEVGGGQIVVNNGQILYELQQHRLGIFLWYTRLQFAHLQSLNQLPFYLS
jgi:hypothetical protein